MASLSASGAMGLPQTTEPDLYELLPRKNSKQTLRPLQFQCERDFATVVGIVTTFLKEEGNRGGLDLPDPLVIMCRRAKRDALSKLIALSAENFEETVASAAKNYCRGGMVPIELTIWLQKKKSPPSASSYLSRDQYSSSSRSESSHAGTKRSAPHGTTTQPVTAGPELAPAPKRPTQTIEISDSATIMAYSDIETIPSSPNFIKLRNCTVMVPTSELQKAIASGGTRPLSVQMGVQCEVWRDPPISTTSLGVGVTPTMFPIS